MMTIMRMCSAFLTIAYYISALLESPVITFLFGKIAVLGYLEANTQSMNM